ncbi:hypothetical protein AB0B62_08000 [Micromonospora chalcea]|uniref:hypothetical protein n=2 Tax=Micromonosporaceae TaxID=28056 RepID=UPI001F2B80BE|nr:MULTISPECIES: hypothetical protein [Micromonospora]MBP1780377.1 hypothetical protein [Micromonospora sp. HB375]MDH6468601.1 hypothetical protein [Micromonospora sp. H404/HB375]WBB84406.1 hypothetical protein O7542_24160 [Micromonospora sp. WMMC264]WDP98717.1 hypothetical protein PVK74_23000 [Micromonospora chalcea]
MSVVSPPPTPVRVAGARSALWSLTMTAVLVGFGLAVIVVTAAVGHLTVGLPIAVPISVGLVGCLAFAVGLRLLHRGWWLTLLSVLPALFVLVGAVQLAPESVLRERGVAQQVTITDVQTAGKRHEFALQGDAGRLDEPLVYRGSSPGYRVGQRLTVLVDPRGEVELTDARDVDPDGKRGMLVFGAAGWTLFALVGGWRGHVSRARGRAATAPPVVI